MDKRDIAMGNTKIQLTRRIYLKNIYTITKYKRNKNV